MQRLWKISFPVFLFFVFLFFAPFGLRLNGLEKQTEPEHDLVFVILCHVRHLEHEALWKRCYDSIREYYPNTSVVLIDDASPIPISNDTLERVKIVRSEYPGAGELLPYHYFLEQKWAKKMVFLHDSMFLRRPFTESELSSPIKFHWYFDTHVYDDVAGINQLLSSLEYASELIEYNVNHKNEWWGCFGVTTIIDWDTLETIEQKYKLVETLKGVVKNRDMRCCLERVFGIIFFKEGLVNKGNCSNFGNIAFYPSCYIYGLSQDVLDQIKASYQGAIMKTFHAR